MSIFKGERIAISERISPIFDQVIGEYDFDKYPPQSYEHFKSTFSSLHHDNDEIENAMKWKWGHWGKTNFPQSHKDLIGEIEGYWPEFVASNDRKNPELTFQWWKGRFRRKTTFISAAFITHLVHHAVPLPIIDQHNFGQ